MVERVLFLGLGGVGQRHLRNLLKLEPNVQIAAVRSLNRSFAIGSDLMANQAIDIVQHYKIRLFPSIEEAIHDFKPDAAIIASPTSAHFSQALPLIKAQIPILLEKPACASENELEAMQAAVKESPCLVMLSYMLRFHPTVIRLLEEMQQNRIGKIYSGIFEANSYLPAWHPYEKPNQFYAGRADLGGGVVLTESHIVNIMCAILGTPLSLWAKGGKLSPYDIDVEDTVTTLLAYDDFAVSLHQSFVQRPPRFAISLRGEKGRIDWSLLDNRLVIEDAAQGCKEIFEAPNFERNEMFILEMQSFLDCVREQKSSPTSLEQAANGEKVLHRIKQSLKSGHVENL